MRYPWQSLTYSIAPPVEMLDATTSAPADDRDLYVDADIYVLTEGDVVRYRDGQADTSFQLDIPAGMVDYRYLDGLGSPADGGLYVYDAAGQRLLEFAKADGRLVREWTSGGADPTMADVRGLVVLAGEEGEVPNVTWMTTAGIFESQLSTAPGDAPGDDSASQDPATPGRHRGEPADPRDVA